MKKKMFIGTKIIIARNIIKYDRQTITSRSTTTSERKNADIS